MDIQVPCAIDICLQNVDGGCTADLRNLQPNSFDCASATRPFGARKLPIQTGGNHAQEK